MQTRYCFIFYVTLQFLSELNNIFHVKGLKRLTFCVKLINDRRKKKNIELLDLIRKVNLLRLWRGNGGFSAIGFIFKFRNLYTIIIKKNKRKNIN